MSEPIFEASVRLQADVSDFEQQAQQSVKRVLDGIEQQTQQALRNSQQQVAQATQQLQQRAQQVAATPPQPVQPPPPPQLPQPSVVEPPEVPPAPPAPEVVYPSVVEEPVVPPVPEPPPVVIPVELADIQAEIDAAARQFDALKQSGEDARRELAAVQEQLVSLNELRQQVPERAFATTPEAGELASLERRAEELQKQIGLEGELADATRERLNEASRAARDFRPQEPQAPPQLAQAIEQAQALATQPIDFTLQANTEQFEQQTTAAFAKARQLAEQNANDLARIAERAATESADAFDAVATAPDRQVAVAEARLKAAVSAQASAAQEAADDFVKQIEGAAFDASVRPSQELQTLAELAATQASTAGLLGDEAGRAAKELEAATLQTLAAAEASEFQAQGFIAEAQAEAGAERDLLQAKADNAIVAAEKLRAEANRLEREGLQPPGQPPGPDDRRGGFLDAFRSTAAGRTGGLGGLIGGAARFGIAGFAATAAFQAFSELTQMLRVTGDEAFTTEGRIRNLGAELLTGNIIGGIKALTEQKKATFIDGLSEAMEGLKARTDETIISLEEVVKLQAGGGIGEPRRAISIEPGERVDLKAEFEGATDALEQFLSLQITTGALSEAEAKKIAAVAVEQEKLYRQAGVAVEEFARKREAAAAAGQREALIPSGTPGAATQRTGIPAGVGFPTPELATQAGGAILAAQNQIRATLAEREENDVKRAQLELDNARFIQVQADSAALSAKGTGKYAAALVTRELAETQVLQAQRAVEAAVAESAARGNRIRASLNERIQGEEERLQADLQSARTAERQARATFAAAKDAADGSGAAADEYEKVVAATTRTANAAQAVKDQAAQAAEAMQTAADRIAAAGVSAIRDPEAQAQAQLALDQARQAREGNELEQARADFEKKKIDAVALRQAEAEYAEAVAATKTTQNQIADAQEAAAEATAASNKAGTEQKLENDIAAAALTKRISDDKKAFDAAIKYWIALRNNAANVEEREAARTKVQSLFVGRAAALGGGADSGLLQQQLQNQLAAAELAGNLPAQERAAQQLVDFWEKQVKGAKGVEKAQAQASLIGAEGRLESVEEARLANREQVIQNRINRARLTPGLGDDKTAADALVKFWEKQVADAKGADKVRKEARLIAAQLARQGLEGEAATAGQGPTTVDFLKISQGIMRDFAGNLLPTGGPEAARALFPGFAPELPSGIADIDTSDVFGRAVQVEEESRDELRAIRRFIERNGVGTTTVNVNQNMRTPDPSGFAQARWARFAMEEAFNG